MSYMEQGSASETSRTFRLPLELDVELERIATENDRSVSAEIRRAVQQYVENELARRPKTKGDQHDGHGHEDTEVPSGNEGRH